MFQNIGLIVLVGVVLAVYFWSKKTKGQKDVVEPTVAESEPENTPEEVQEKDEN